MIKAVMSGKDFAAKGEVIKFLAKFDDENSFNAIISQMNHPANSIRSDVAAALSASRNPKAFGYLMRLRDDADKFVRLAVMQGLGRKGTAESVKIVKEMLQEERNKELYEFVKFYLEKEL
jgi:HEAT repeat protein